MQLYKGLDTITNKVTTNEMNGIPHHLMNILDPSEGEEFDVQTFVKEAHQIVSTSVVNESDVSDKAAVGRRYYLSRESPHHCGRDWVLHSTLPFSGRAYSAFFTRY